MSGALQKYCLVEVEKLVCDRLYRYYEIKEALALEKEEKGSFFSTSREEKIRSNRPTNPTLSQFLRMTDPIKNIELPDIQIQEEYLEKGNKKLRIKKVPGILIQDPLKWIRLMDSLREIFRGSTESFILENYFFRKKKASEVAGMLKISKSQVHMSVSKILGLAIGFAMIGDLR